MKSVLVCVFTLFLAVFLVEKSLAISVGMRMPGKRAFKAGVSCQCLSFCKNSKSLEFFSHFSMLAKLQKNIQRDCVTA